MYANPIANTIDQNFWPDIVHIKIHLKNFITQVIHKHNLGNVTKNGIGIDSYIISLKELYNSSDT